MKRVLVAEPDPALMSAIAAELLREGCQVLTAQEGGQAFSLAKGEALDLVLVDLELPGADGLEICRRLRAHSAVPLIVLGARDSELERVVALEVGADDFLCKPLRLRELVARMRSLWRRVSLDRGEVPRVASQADRQSGNLEVGPVMVDTASRLAVVQGKRVLLRPREFDLLRLLMQNAGTVLTYKALMEELWGGRRARGAGTVYVHVHSLRGKLEEDPRRPQLIVTVRGVGYRFEPGSGELRQTPAV